MMRVTWRGILAAGSLLTGASTLSMAGVADECRQDLESIPGYLLANDAGGRDAWDRYGEAHFNRAMDEARAAVAGVTDESACVEILRSYLKSWRAGHLNVRNTIRQPGAASARDEKPRVDWLSARTVLLTVPSFASSWGEAVARLLKDNRRNLARHPNWIIDVRGNPGGSDDVYAEILRWIGAAERVDVQVEYLATADNIDAASHFCEVIAPGNAHCEQAMKEERERMQSVRPGSWVLQKAGDEVMAIRQSDLEPVRPTHVAILVDSGCGSSCEQFLLDARQSFSVKLIGQHSYGTLDYSNLRPHVLPSGHHMLIYAVTRSHRIPGMPVDPMGVMPDIYVPPEQANPPGGNLAKRVQRWLDGGSLITV
jgi:C-terminal processing protease CtpA/Prc